MKYFIDCEFLEGKQKEQFPISLFRKETKPTIDLISIALVAEDGREYYAVSKDFNLKEAWNRFDLELEKPEDSRQRKFKIYWIRENVLKPIFNQCKSELNAKIVRLGLPIGLNEKEFNYKNFKHCIKYVGKTNKQISEEIYKFVFPEFDYSGEKYLGTINKFDNNFLQNYWVKDIYMNPQFYGYYSAYDHVALCWLFGKMIDLPKGFPMYTIDLKQVLDNRLKTYTSTELSKAVCPSCKHNVYETMDYEKPLVTMEKCIKDHPNYPKQTNEHNALADARWNKELYEFLKQL